MRDVSLFLLCVCDYLLFLKFHAYCVLFFVYSCEKLKRGSPQLLQICKILRGMLFRVRYDEIRLVGKHSVLTFLEFFTRLMIVVEVFCLQAMVYSKLY